jgi:hypothetical protein
MLPHARRRAPQSGREFIREVKVVSLASTRPGTYVLTAVKKDVDGRDEARP